MKGAAWGVWRLQGACAKPSVPEMYTLCPWGPISTIRKLPGPSGKAAGGATMGWQQGFAPHPLLRTTG